MQPSPLRVAQRRVAFENHADRAHRREGPHHPGHRAQHAVGGACVAIVGVEGVADEAAVAGVPRQMAGEVGDLTLEAAERGAGQRHAGGDAGVRDEQAGGEVVAAVEDHAGPLGDLRGVRSPHTADDRAARDGGIEALEPGERRFRLGPADVGGGEGRLALEVGLVDRVAVDQRQPPDPGARQVLQRRAADPATADQNDMRLGERDLAGAADLGQDDMAGETVQAFGR